MRVCQRGPGQRGEIMDRQHGRGSSGNRHQEGIKYRRTQTWGLAQHSELRGPLQIFGRVSEGRGEGVRNPAEEDRGRRGDTVEVAPRVTVESLTCFRAALIGPSQGLPKRCQL